ncbi:MAG: flagellar filament capping protein FliD [Pseudomonadota bacterium]|nr:flagellar filament capping protein FliD [Pseudomonadota bacterium]
MANEIGTTLLNSLTNSTFDIGNMAKVMAEADVAGPKLIVERNQDKVSTELDAIKFLETNLNAFNSYLTDLSSPDLFSQRTATSSDESVVSITSTSSATMSTYQIESRQLAQAHTVVANKTYTSPSDTVSNGTLDLAVGGQTHSITVDATNNTLEGLQNVINSGDYGVTASIINNAGSYQMMFTSKQTGAAGEVSLSGLADFDTSGFTTTAEAQDAVMVLNGLTVTSDTNTFDDVIEGVSFNLNSAAIGSPKTLSVSQDSEQVSGTIASFVDVYNQLQTILDELGSYDKSDLTEAELESEEFQYYGDLAGNSLLRSVRSQIESSLTGAITELTGSYNTLSSVGLTFDREGVLELDESKLNAVIETDMQALSNLLAKGGSSDDALINVTGGNERTQTGAYALDITQLAERASVSGGAVVTTADERVSGDRVLDSVAALTVDAGATFDLTIGATTQTINMAAIAGNYATKDEVATGIQTQVDSAFGAGVASILYDSSQSRFEVSAATGQGVASLANVAGLTNQGFTATNYTGEQLIDLSAAAATFDVKIDDSVTSTVSLQAERYTLGELAQAMASAINSNTDVQAAEGSVSVSTTGGLLNISSARFGIFSAVELTNVTNLTNAGLTADINDIGQNVDGTITTESGVLNIGAYADSDDGRKIKVSDYAVIAGEEAEVRGLEFEVLGGVTGARGNLTYAQGFASLIEETVKNLFEEDTGLVAQRIESLNDKNDRYDEKTKDIDVRYEKMLLKYQMQFSMLQSIISSSEQTRDYLSATFSNSNS